MKGKSVVLAGILMLVMLATVFVSPAFAECKCKDKVTSDNWAVRAPSRLLHGVTNAGGGWTQLFIEPVRSVKHQDQNVVDGIFDGLGYTVYYTALGAWDLATFWVPGQGGKDIAVKTCWCMPEN